MIKKLTLLILVCFITSFPKGFAQSVVINEVLASNKSVNLDEENTYQDWIELYNNSNVAVSLNGFGLSDDKNLPFKWLFPNVTIGSGEYLLVYCSGKDRAIAGSPLHTNFKIGASGENLILYNNTGVIVDEFLPIAMSSDQSYGRVPNGTGGFELFTVPTPLSLNNVGNNLQVLAPPLFSHSPGFYTNGFNLSLSTLTSGATIIYTLDGSEPSVNNLLGTTYEFKNQYAELANQSTGVLLQNSYTSNTYSGAISIIDRTSENNKLANISSTHHFSPDYFPNTSIFKGTVVRAKVVKNGYIDSEVITHTYFIDPLGKEKYQIPVVSIAINEDELFNYDDGIFVAGKIFDQWRIDNPTTDATDYNFDGNFRVNGKTSERKAHFSYYINGLEVFGQNLGLRVHGGSTRAWASKSFTLNPSVDYGSSNLSYPFFSNISTTKFDRLLLRNSGNDFFSTMYRDALGHEMLTGLVHMTVQAYQPTITFVNGEFWGLLNLRENYDADYFKNKYDITSLDLLLDDLTPVEGDADFYETMETFLENNSLSNSSNYDYIQTLMDVENMRDYYIANIYLSNVDWPAWNTLFWRNKIDGYDTTSDPMKDGRLRAGIKDLDDGFGYTTGTFDHNTLEFATEPNGPSYPNSPQSTLILRSLLANTQFKNNFINRFADLLNTHFLPARVVAISNKMEAAIAPYMDVHLERWSPIDRGWWEFSVGFMNDYLTNRPAFQREHIRNKFGLTNDIQVTVAVDDVSKGYVKVNTVDIISTTPGVGVNPYPWTGTYFSDVPITIEAKSLPGYVFSHWSGDISRSEPEITTTSNTNINVIANYIVDPNPDNSEIMYYWFMDDALPNNEPLTTVNSTYAINESGVLQYESCIPEYPLTISNVLWRHAALERKNNPTSINYQAAFNNQKDYANSNMRGIQVKQPFKNGNLQNVIILEMSTKNYKDMVLSFAAVDEGAVSGVEVAYATNSGTPVWITEGLTKSNFYLTNQYQLIQVDFTNILKVNNNQSFKVKITFIGDNLLLDEGKNVTFNNISLKGVLLNDLPNQNSTLNLESYPNPVKDVLYIENTYTDEVDYQLITSDGKKVLEGNLNTPQIDVSKLEQGLYFLHFKHQNKTQTSKIIKY